MTIQRYLLIVILSVVVLATFSAALQGFKVSNHRLNDVFDEEMQSIALVLKNTPMQSSNEQVDTHSSFAFQIWRSGSLIVKSNNAPTEKISSVKIGFGNTSFLGDRWRYYSLTENGIQVVVAQPVSQRIESIEEVLLSAVLPIVFAIPIIGLVIFFAIRKSLSPLKELSEKVRLKDASDLSSITLQNSSKELDPIKNRINGLLQRLADAFEREQTLASNAAHELRTPISVLKLNAHNIKVAYELGDIRAHHINELTQNTDRMAHVIEQVIALNRTTPENFEAKKTAFNIEQLLQAIIASNYQKLDEQKQTIALNSSHIEIVADKFSLETLFNNLVVNAIKYSGTGSEILVSTCIEGRWVKCSVEDSGLGIDDDQLDKVLQRFYRVKQHEQTGSGLGLSIVSHIVELHHGQISLGRSPLGGLLVDIQLPLFGIEDEDDV